MHPGGPLPALGVPARSPWESGGSGGDSGSLGHSLGAAMMAFALVKPRVSQMALALGLSGGESRRVHWAAVRRHCGTGTRTEQAGAETRSSQQPRGRGLQPEVRWGVGGLLAQAAHGWRVEDSLTPRSQQWTLLLGPWPGGCRWLPAAPGVLPGTLPLTGLGADRRRSPHDPALGLEAYLDVRRTAWPRGRPSRPAGLPVSGFSCFLPARPLGTRHSDSRRPRCGGPGRLGRGGVRAWGRESRRENMAGGGAEAGPGPEGKDCGAKARPPGAGPASGRAHQDLCAPLPSCWWLQGLPGASGPAQGRTTSPLWARGGSRQAAGGHKAGVWRPCTPSAPPPPSTSRLCSPGPVLGRGRRAPALGSARAAGQTVITGNLN